VLSRLTNPVMLVWARIAIICDNYSPHLTTRKDARVGTLGGGK
jgi:hypothetical protein